MQEDNKISTEGKSNEETWMKNCYVRFEIPTDLWMGHAAAGSGIMLQDGRSRVRDPMSPLIRNEYKNLFWGAQRSRQVKAGNLTAIYVPIVWTMWDHQHLTTLRTTKFCSRDGFLRLCGLEDVTRTEDIQSD
jgi:hypothetical protein